MILRRRKHAAKHWLNTQGLKEATRYRAVVSLFTLLAARQSEAVVGINGHVLENRVLPLPIQVVRRGDRECGHSRKALCRRDMPNIDQTVGFPECQRTQQRSVHDGEDCGIRPNSKRQSDHGNGGEPGTLPQLTNRIENILKYSIHSKLIFVAHSHHWIDLRLT